MELFGIGPFELLLIILVALLIFGPKDLEKAGLALGRALYRFMRSDLWKDLKMVGEKLKTGPYELMRMASLEEKEDEFRVETGTAQAAVPPANPDPIVETPPEADNHILPSRQDDGKN